MKENYEDNVGGILPLFKRLNNSATIRMNYDSNSNKLNYEGKEFERLKKSQNDKVITLNLSAAPHYLNPLNIKKEDLEVFGPKDVK